MTQPAFRQPRDSGWGYDVGRKLAYRRIDGYLNPVMAIQDQLTACTTSGSVLLFVSWKPLA